MGAFLKIIIGAILILGGLALFLDSVDSINLIPNGKYFLLGKDLGNIDWLGHFFILLTGMIPAFVILIGLFIVWLELDELKIQKELKVEEKKEEKKEKK